jgi:hypothetical protein
MNQLLLVPSRLMTATIPVENPKYFTPERFEKDAFQSESKFLETDEWEGTEFRARWWPGDDISEESAVFAFASRR